LLAALKDDATAVDSAELEETLRGPVALMIGNEGAGLSEDWVRMADRRVTIPCPGFVESLNAAVAGSILLWEVARRRNSRA
jgi:TrmH family RNA methyltransferase